MYHKYYTLLILAGCFSGHLIGQHENNTDVGSGTDTIFESLGKEFLVGPSYRKSGNLQYAQIQVDQETENASSSRGLSGYHALKNAFLTKSLIDSKPENRASIADDFKNAVLSEELFGKEGSLWRSDIIESRRKGLAALYLRDKIILGLLNCTKTPNSDEFVFNFYAHAPVSLSLEKARVALDKTKVSEEQLHDMRTICTLPKQVAQELVESALLKRGDTQDTPNVDPYLVTHDEIIDTFVKVCGKKRELDPSGDQERRLKEAVELSSLKSKESLEKYFTPFENQEFSIVANANSNEVIVAGNSYHKKTYGPESETTAKDGSWLLLPEIIEIAQKEKNDTSRMFHEEFKVPVDVHAFDFSEGLSDFEKMSTTMRCADALERVRKSVNPVTTMLLIVQDNSWFSCVITKLASDFWFIVTDSRNADRSHDPLISTLAGMMAENAPKKTIGGVKDFLDKAAATPKESKEEVVNYDAPLAQIALEELPMLEDFFGGKISNDIQMILKQLETSTTTSKKPLKVKNGLILSGPPGTGKSTIAQIMARTKGREVLYAGGGDFRTAYQGSSKAKLDDLFRKAKELNKPCVVLIDEIDGTSSKLQPHGSTQEDNRAIKALITTLDQYKNDPSIYVICTTNYPEKMDPAVLRRFTRLEVPLPNYDIRRKIVDLYIKKNGLEVKNDDPRAITPAFYEMFVSATDGFSGDALENIINTAVVQAESGLTAEDTIGTRFRCNSIDVTNHSLISTAANLVALPFFQAFHWLGGYAHSDMDEHIFSQFSRHKKLKEDLESKEFEEVHKGHKFTDLLSLQYLGYILGTGMLQGVANLLVSSTAIAGKEATSNWLKNRLPDLKFPVI